ncbi:MAG: hypothetical protein HOY78_23500 [Saccharothrix sp.]|nr:hypothetical protein [Saccharothrix sp.]
MLRLVWRKLRELVERLRRKDPDPQRKDPREVERQRKEREKRELMEEAQGDGVKLDPDKVVEIGKDPNGKIVFLEEGGVNPRAGKEAGLAHVMKHKDEFVAEGIPRGQDRRGRAPRGHGGPLYGVLPGQTAGTADLRGRVR